MAAAFINLVRQFIINLYCFHAAFFVCSGIGQGSFLIAPSSFSWVKQKLSRGYKDKFSLSVF